MEYAVFIDNTPGCESLTLCSPIWKQVFRAYHCVMVPVIGSLQYSHCKSTFLIGPLCRVSWEGRDRGGTGKVGEAQVRMP